MKTKIPLILAIIVGLGTSSPLLSQETLRERIAQKQRNSFKRQQPYNNEKIENAKWSRIIYRYLDLHKEANAPLYYPSTPANGQTNLFTQLFRLLQEGTLEAYEYLDGREEFTEDYKVDFRELLERFDIYHETTNGKITINESDIPGNEVEGYFVKEAYYFDNITSTFRITVLAICPVLLRSDNYGAVSRYPLFWVPYPSIASYMQRIPIMSSSLNNNMNGTIDDFFRMRKYAGEIYKAQNPRNLAISQYTSGPEEMKAEQERIEKELADFEKMLWEQEKQSAIPRETSTLRRGKKRQPTTTSGNSSVSMRDRRY